ncbi:MAG TPA: tetratricopeptide repeat protein [bacterium]
MRTLLVMLALLVLMPSVGRAAVAADPLAAGIARYQAARFTEALQLFLRAAALQPESGRGWVWLGATYLQLERRHEAILALQRALALDPQNAAADVFLGIAYMRLGQNEQARAAFERAYALGGDSVYGSAAAQWLSVLSAPGGPAPSPTPTASARVGTCPAVPQLPTAKAPPPPPAISANIHITDWNISVAGDQLVIEGTVDNDGNQTVQDVRVETTGIGLTGAQVGSGSVTLAGPLETAEGRNFLIRIGTSPPPMWVRLSIANFIGPGAGDRLHAVLIPVPTATYADLARARVKMASSISPPTVARGQSVCTWIADGAGFPIGSVRARVIATGATPGGPVPQVRSIDLTAGQGATVTFSWTSPVTVTVRIEIESIQLGAPAGHR